jgi:recombination associated protein RdgC
MFRNARMYRLESDWPDSEAAASEELAKASFTPCGPLTERSSGWIPVDTVTEGNDLLARRVNGADLIVLRSQSRVLPAAAVNEALETRIADFRDRMQEEPGRREKRRLKAETREELLPKALLKSDKIRGFVDLAEQLLVVDAGQAAAAERFLRHLRLPFGELNIRPVDYREPIGGLLTQIFLGNGPQDFALGRECRMQDATDTGSTVRWNDFDLSERSIRSHVADGMRLTHLAVVYDNVLGCVIDEHGVVSKLRFLGTDDADTGTNQNPLAQQDAEFVLLTSTLRSMVADLKKLLGGFATAE